MTFEIWFVIVGVLFVFLALANTTLRRLPLSTTMLYLALGVALGPVGLGFSWLDPLAQAAVLERAAEIVVIISLFTAGLKLRLPLSDERWHPPLRLAFVSMTLTVVMVAAVGVLGMGLSLGMAVLLGAVLAPTDPVLASDVQVSDPGDRDRLRFSLTGEAGFNDGTAFPFVMLGLGLLGLHELGDWGWRWLVVDVGWAVVGGLAIGALLGTQAGRLVLYLRHRHEEAVGTDDFLALGLVALTYGLALLMQTYGFLAVFAAGLALRRMERRASARHEREEDTLAEIQAAAKAGKESEVATDPSRATAYMVQAVLGFNEQLERIGQIGIVLVVGGILFTGYLPAEALWFAPILFFVIRPLSVGLGLWGAGVPRVQRALIGWFGIRGVGSVYYLMYAIEHGLSDGQALLLASLVLTVVALSVVVHGTSVTPLMNAYGRWVERQTS